MKKLTRFELLMTTVGTVVGSGIVTGTGLAIAVTGRSVHISYFIAILIGFALAIPTIFNSSIMRIDGATYTVNRIYAGTLVAGSASIASVLNFLGNGMMSISLATYIASLVPALSATVPFRILGAVILTFFTAVNLKSTKLMARVQSVLTPIMFCGLGIFVVAGLFKLQYNPFGFSEPGFFKGGADGVMTGAMILAFSTQGTTTAMFFSKQSSNPKKDVPWAILMATVAITIIYCSISLVDGNVLPVAQVAGKPLTVVAQSIMPKWAATLFVIFGPMMCLATTVNGGFAGFYRPIAAASQEGLLPKFIGKENKDGIPYRIVFVQWVAGMIPIVTGMSLTTLMSALVLTTALLGIFSRLGAFRMPTMFPEQWKKSHLHVPDPVYYFFCTIAFVANLFLVWRSIKTLSTGIVIMNFVVLAASFVYCYFRLKSGKVTPRSITYSFEDEDESQNQGRASSAGV